MLGLLVVDKPLNYSSQQVVKQIKRLGQCKTGHGGALDVMATGVLPIFLGEATKFSQFALNADKTYRVKAQLGKRTSTGDAEGDIIKDGLQQLQSLTKSDIVKCVEEFKGESQQVPSMYSALKHNGQPLYRLARQGKEVERASRTIHIKELTIIDVGEDFCDIEVKCSKGTYIRNLVDDIGEILGCGAHVSYLRRTGVADLTIDQAYLLESLQTSSQQFEQAILPVDTFLNDYPVVQLDHDQVKRLRYGQVVVTSNNLPGECQLMRVYSEDSQAFIGLAECQGDKLLKAKRLLAY